SDLLDVFAHCAIDFSDFRQLLTSDRPVRTGIGANLRAIHGKIDTLQQPHIHTLLHDSLEEFQKERRLLKTAVSIFGERRMMRNLLIEAEASEPAISKMHSNVLDQPALTRDSVR